MLIFHCCIIFHCVSLHKGIGVSFLLCVSFFYLKIFFVELQLIDNVVLVSGVQQSDSVIHTYIFFFRFFCIIGYYKILSIVPIGLYGVSGPFSVFVSLLQQTVRVSRPKSNPLLHDKEPRQPLDNGQQGRESFQDQYKCPWESTLPQGAWTAAS